MVPTSSSVPGASQRFSLDELKSFASRLADRAGEVTLDYFRRSIDVENKSPGGGFDPVTAADRQAEQAIRELIEATFPDHGIFGEEGGTSAGRSPYTWYIDPIDGTRSFIAGVPLWGTLIGLNDGARAVLGLCDQPYLRERYVGLVVDDIKEATLDARGRVQSLRTRATRDLGAALLTCTTPALFTTEAEKAAYRELEGRCRLARYSLDCYGYCLLAAGSIDLVVEAGLSAYDIQPLMPIIEAAGGSVANWRGEPPLGGGQVVAAATSALLEQALAILGPAASP